MARGILPTESDPMPADLIGSEWRMLNYHGESMESAPVWKVVGAFGPTRLLIVPRDLTWPCARVLQREQSIARLLEHYERLPVSEG